MGRALRPLIEARAARLCETVLVVGGDVRGFTPYEEALAAEDPASGC